MARSLFQKVILSSSLFMLTACAGGALMTRSDFDNIEVGTPVSEIVQRYGDPVKVKDNKDGSQSYKYVERLPIADETVAENNYFLIIKNGKVVSKQYNYETPQAFDEIYDPDPNDTPN